MDDFEKWIENGELNKLIEDTAEMIKPYVESDPTKFCTAEEFENGVTALSEFVTLRGEAVSRQLEGDDTKVDASGLNISDMGTMGRGMGGMGGNGRNFNRNMSDDTADNMPEGMPDNMPDNMPENFPGDMPAPGNTDAGSTDTGTSPANSFESGSPEMPFGNMEIAVGSMQESDTVSAD